MNLGLLPVRPAVAARLPDAIADQQNAGKQRRHPNGFGSREAVLSAISRLESVLGEEITALAKPAAADLSSTNNKKSHLLVDLNSALQTLRPSDVDHSIVSGLMQLREKLADNMSVLRMHMEAAKEISSVLSESVLNSQSDGTYTRVSTSRRPR